MKKILTALAFAATALFGANALAQAPNAGDPIVVGSKQFTEQIVLGKVIIQALENAGYEVEDRTNLGGTAVNRDALEAGEIDVYPNYNGTAISNWYRDIPWAQESIPEGTSGDAYASYATVSALDAAIFDLVWLRPAPANNTYALAVTRAWSEENGVTTMPQFAEYVNDGGEVVAKRSHRMNDRSAWRLFGLPYAHPHPKSADTTIIKNKAGLPLPTELTGEPAQGYLIDKKEQGKRRASMRGICLQCHATSWVDGHFARFEKSIETTNQMTRTATDIILAAWKKGLAKGLDKQDSIFNEAIERMWVEQWLFYANSTRFASAMGGADYGVFAEGRWYMSKNIQQMADWLRFLGAAHKDEKIKTKK